MQTVKLTRGQPQWYTLKSSRKGGKKKDSSVSGEIQLQFALVDSTNPGAAPRETYQKLMRLIAGANVEDEDGNAEGIAKPQSRDDDDDDEDDEDEDDAADTSEETDDANKPEVDEKRKRKLRLKRLRKKSKATAYEFSGAGGDVIGIVFLEIVKAVDLPPERNSMPSFTLSKTLPAANYCQ